MGLALRYFSVGGDINEILEGLPPYMVSMARVYGMVPFDRFGYMPSPSDWELHPASVYEPRRCEEYFEDIALRRAEELLDLDKPLYVYWSGGIDSTVVMAALIQMGAHRSNLTVVCDRHSLAENRAFYDRHIQGRFNTCSTAPLPVLLLNTPSFCQIVTGEHNDQLNGSDIMFDVVQGLGVHVLHQPAVESRFQPAAQALGFTEEEASLIFQAMLGSSGLARVQLLTVFDVFWWINFATKWQCVHLRMLLGGPRDCVEEMRQQHYDRVHHFFGTTDWQDWAITGHEEKIAYNWRTYKLPSKRFIHDFDGCKEYLEHAIKAPSLGNVQPDGRVRAEILGPDLEIRLL